MAVLALGLIGQAIGGAIGGTFLGVTAAAWGFTAGTMVGNLLTQKSQHFDGPRVGDLSVQASTYGGMKPILYGSMRTAGNVIFCTDKREVSTTTRQGKGGPKVSSTTYSYNVDMAVALCAGPIAGVRKIWRNGELVYDVSSDSSVETILGSSVHADGFRVYLGTEDQLPDPTIEATVGVGSTPAYRGTAYVVFDHMDCPNGQIPQLSFEVVSVATDGTESPLFSQATAPVGPVMCASIVEDKAWQFVQVNGESPVRLVGMGYESLERNVSFALGDAAEYPPVPCQGGPYALMASHEGSYAGPWHLTTANLETGEVTDVLTYEPGSRENALLPFHAAYDPVSGKFCAIDDAAGNPLWNRGRVITILPDNVTTPELEIHSVRMAFYDGIIYCCSVRSGITYLRKYSGVTGAYIGEVSAGQDLGASGLALHADAGGVYVLNSYGAGLAVDRSVWKVTDDGWQLLTSTAHFENLNGQVETFYANDSYAIVGPSLESGGLVDYRVIFYSGLDGAEVPVADVIEDICQRAGMDAAQVDASSVADTLHGYAINRVTSGRSNLDPLLKAYFIDVAEVDGVLTFFKRPDQAVVATIPYAELGASEPGGPPADPLPLTRTQESELPRSVAVTFINKDADYQPGTETARRQVTASIHDVADEIAIATTSGHMSTVAAAMLYDAWSARTQRKASLTRKYARLDVGDNLNIEYPEGTYSTKRITRLNDTGVIIELDLVDSDPSLYELTVPGATPAAGQAGVGFLAPTRLALMDIPLLRDADSNAGLYAALQGFSPAAWSGATLYAGADAGSLSPQGGVSTPAVMGVATTALPGWTLGLVDEANTVQVQLHAGTLASTTHDTMLDGTTNAALLGDEIIQFKTATALGGGLYRLSGLLRGRRGTEWAAAGHAAGERFVLLQESGMLRVPMDLADVGVARSYQAVTLFQSADAAAVQSLASTAAGLKPVAPAGLDVRQSGTVFDLRWLRRSRLRDNWLAGTVPLGEADESYEIEVTMPGGTVQTYDATEPAAVLDLAGYTAAGLQVHAGAARWAVASGGYVYAYAGALVVKMDASDLSVVASAAAIYSTAMILAAGAIYTIDTGNPAGGVFGKLRKWTLDLTLSASLELPMLADGFGLTYCAGSLWASLPYSGVVRRINPSTLATVADVAVDASILCTDGTYVYARSAGTDEVFKIDPASNTVVLTIALTGSPQGSVPGNGVSMAAAAGLLWVPAAVGITVYSTMSGLPYAHTIDAPGVQVTTDGSVVCVFSQASRSGVVIDAATVEQLGSFTVPAASAAASALPSAAILGADQLVVDDGAAADYYERTTDLSGAVIRVYQMSAAVGRGFAAQAEIA